MSEPKSYPVDKQANDWLERAKAAQAQRRSISDISVRAKITIPQKELIAKHAPECVGADATYHPLFGDRNLSETYVDEGYEPVMFQGKQVQYGGDPLWKLPMDLHKQNVDVNAIRSATMLGEAEDSDLGEIIPDDNIPLPQEIIVNKQMAEAVNAVVDDLPNREAVILRMRYGLNGGKTHSFKEVGDFFNLSRERVRQIEKQTLARLRSVTPAILDGAVS